jgi:hypothetical protein
MVVLLFEWMSSYDRSNILSTEYAVWVICIEFNLRSVDLNLLPIFEAAAYEERNLSRAAQRLAMRQPAMSHAISRLRHVFKDELRPQLEGRLADAGRG